jgi:hypothetical protein
LINPDGHMHHIGPSGIDLVGHASRPLRGQACNPDWLLTPITVEPALSLELLCEKP